VASQAANAQGDDGGEADGLEEQRQHEHGHAGVVAAADAGGDEDDGAGDEEHQHDARPHVAHEERAGEAPRGEAALGAGEEFGGQRGRGVGPRFDHVVDEVAADGDWQ
jgi:hypothetical protein